MQIVLGLSLLLFVATSTIVGVRMLLLAGRSGGRPELLMGAGMVLIGAVGYPGGVVSGFGQANVGHVHFWIWAVSSAATQLGIALIYAFTAQVFRSGVAWAKGLTVAGCAFMLAGFALTIQALLTSSPGLSSALAARTGTLVGLVGYSGGFLWTAIEGFSHHRMARRRLALGLAEPLVAGRFFLWGLFGMMACLIIAVSGIEQFMRGHSANSPASMISMGAFGVTASVAMYLAFFAPRWYVARVERRAAPPGDTARA